MWIAESITINEYKLENIWNLYNDNEGPLGRAFSVNRVLYIYALKRGLKFNKIEIVRSIQHLDKGYYIDDSTARKSCGADTRANKRVVCVVLDTIRTSEDTRRSDKDLRFTRTECKSMHTCNCCCDYRIYI